uniref:Ig-like domain-containing protein n=1 Tax=Urocitellus parryii TaxID=9999 RepID=A0A8D2HCX4_UROPR
MGTKLLCWVAVCLLGADHSHAGVSQSPTHRVTKTGQNVTFRCDPIPEHNALYWYRQTLGQGPEFLMYFQNKIAADKSGMPRERFSAERPQGSFSTLEIQLTEPGDSAVYLCASSLAQCGTGSSFLLTNPLCSASSSSQKPCRRECLFSHGRERSIWIFRGSSNRRRSGSDPELLGQTVLDRENSGE